jgi:hypothetical protein
MLDYMEENHTIVGAKIIARRNKWNSWGKIIEQTNKSNNL